MNEELTTVTELKNDGTVEVSYVPAEEFGSAEYVPAEENKSGIGGVVMGVGAAIGAATVIYGAIKGVQKLGKIYKAGVKALAEEDAVNKLLDDGSEDDLFAGVVYDDSDAHDFVEKRKEETASGSKK